VILFYLYKYYSNKTKIEPEIIEIKKREKIDYINILSKIENKYINSSKDIFYSKILEILKLYLEEKENKSISKMTFGEINKLKLDDKIK
jgi:hypothetical protein